jgi:hypothetical protein
VLRGKVHAQRPSLVIQHSPLAARLFWLSDTPGEAAKIGASDA